MDQRFRIVLRDHHAAMHRHQKAFRYRVIEKAQQAIVVTFDIQDPAGLPLKPELRPGQDFAKLLESAIPAWQCDEGIGQPGHQSFPLMHGADYAQLRELAVGYFFVHQGTRDDADYFSAGSKRGIGQRPISPVLPPP